jgi:DNA modification methylase
VDVKGREAQRVKVKLDAVNHGDCLEGLAAMDAGGVDLVFADPPFNIGYEYDLEVASTETDFAICACGAADIMFAAGAEETKKAISRRGLRQLHGRSKEKSLRYY